MRKASLGHALAPYAREEPTPQSRCFSHVLLKGEVGRGSPGRCGGNDRISIQSPAVAQALARAVDLGAEVERIAGDRGLQRLSRAACVRQCLELGGYTTVADLQDARAKLASAPYLKGEVEQRAAIWGPAPPTAAASVPRTTRSGSCCP